MNPETFRDMINEIGKSFQIIINDYDNFDVWKDNKTGKYYFCPVDKIDKDGLAIYESTNEVKLIAVLHYDSTVNITDTDTLHNMFSSTCCGEYINGNAYLWFR